MFWHPSRAKSNLFPGGSKTPRREKDLFPFASAYLLQVALMCFTLETFRSACSILPISFFSLG